MLEIFNSKKITKSYKIYREKLHLKRLKSRLLLGGLLITIVSFLICALCPDFSVKSIICGITIAVIFLILLIAIERCCFTHNTILEEDFYLKESSLPESSDNSAYTILIVDDEPVMQKIMSNILQQAGYKILQARDGKEGVQMAQHYKPDLILFDLMLPEMDGLEACKILKQDPSLMLSKIIVLTARTDEESKITALKNGADDFITKPFSSIEVKIRINNLLQNAKLQKELHLSNIGLSDALKELKETQSQLIHSEKMNAIGNLSAGLLHEVNNPLNYVMTALHLMKIDPAFSENNDSKEVLHDIEEGMARIKSIVTDLHSFAHPDKASEKTSFLAYKIVDSALKFTAYDCKDVEIKNKVADDILVIGSPAHIVQVIINLINNACQAIANSHNSENGCIEISAVKKADRVIISVQDNGSGIDEETRKKIFDPFFTTNEIGEGMGLGLSINHTIIKNHGGLFNVDSKVGQGSTFSFDLESANS